MKLFSLILQYFLFYRINQMKDSKKYNLAIKKQPNQILEYLKADRNLRTISQVPESQGSYQMSLKTVNIFQIDKPQRDERIKEANPPYSVICKRELQSYKSKMIKAKALGIPTIFRMKISQSFLSSSKHTFGELMNSNQCLTKDDLSQFYRKAKEANKIQKDSVKSSEIVNKNLEESVEAYHKSHGLPLLQSMKNSRHFSIQNGRKKMKFLNSSRRLIQTHRKKVQQLCKFTLKSQKQNIQPQSWAENLRSQNHLKSILDHKYIEEIQREGIKLKGNNKLDKEYNCITERKFQLFEPLQKKGKLAKKSCQFSDESRAINSVVDNNMSRVTNLTQIIQ